MKHKLLFLFCSLLFSSLSIAQEKKSNDLNQCQIKKTCKLYVTGWATEYPAIFEVVLSNEFLNKNKDFNVIENHFVDFINKQKLFPSNLLSKITTTKINENAPVLYNDKFMNNVRNTNKIIFMNEKQEIIKTTLIQNNPDISKYTYTIDSHSKLSLSDKELQNINKIIQCDNNQKCHTQLAGFGGEPRLIISLPSKIFQENQSDYKSIIEYYTGIALIIRSTPESSLTTLGKNILNIDDNAQNRRLLKQYLRKLSDLKNIVFFDKETHNFMFSIHII